MTYSYNWDLRTIVVRIPEAFCAEFKLIKNICKYSCILVEPEPRENRECSGGQVCITHLIFIQT